MTPETPPPPTLRVLLLEDSPDDALLTLRELRKGGWELRYRRVDTAADFAEALGQAWDVVVADFSLPAFDAPAALKLMQERGLDLPFIVISGFVGEETAAALMRAGAHDFLLKDNLARLVPAAARELREAEERAARRSAERERELLLASERAARAQAEAASRAKDEFLAIVSHELRTPLTALLGWLEVLREEGATAEERAEALAVVERNLKLQTKIVNDLLDVAAIASGRLRLDSEALDLRPAAAAAVEALALTARAKGLTVRAELPAEPCTVLGDGGRLRQVFWNLLANAVAYTPSGGTVRLSVGRADGRVVATVSDDGDGIPPDVLPHVFERFRQGEETLRRTHGGLGLGLAVVKDLVELHGGTVAAESAGAGKGAAFTVSLPAAAPAAPPAPVAPSAPPKRRPLAGLSVLLVDDDADTRESLAGLLRRRGASVAAAGSAREALTALELARPDALLADVAMPEQDGYALIGEVRARWGGLPAAALTARARPADREVALRAGFDAWLAKPVEADALVALVRRLTRRRGLL